MKVREIVLWTIAVVLAIVIWDLASTRFGDRSPTVTFTEFMTSVDAGKVAKVAIEGSEITATGKDDRTFRTYAPPGATTLVPRLMEKGVQIDVKPERSNPWASVALTSAWGLLWMALPIMTLVLVVVVLREVHILKAKVDRLLGGGEPPDQS